MLSRDDAALEADNPFDPTLLNLDELEDSAWPTGLDQQGIASTQFSAGTDTLPVTSGAASARDSTGGAQATADAATSCEGDPQGAGPVPAAGLEPRVSDSSACVSRLGSCLSGSMWDLMRPSTALRGRRLSMAEIDAQLEALQADKELAQQLKAGQPGKQGFNTVLYCIVQHFAPSNASAVQQPNGYRTTPPSALSFVLTAVDSRVAGVE